ncbi:MAG TPA: 30S ribosomal protein S17 [Candidatus Omnitrophica bacterium]|nr:30S ribosomal protein S17 [Candidatus Omnitrophota bacterium]
MRKEKKGKVISDRMESTVVVEAQNLVFHPVYKKIIRKRKKFVAHNPENRAKEGDIVKIVESRPLSKTKRWKVVEILNSERIQAQGNKKGKK